MRKVIFGVLVAVWGVMGLCGGGAWAASGTWEVGRDSGGGGTYYLNSITCRPGGEGNRLIFSYYTKPYNAEGYSRFDDYAMSVSYIMGAGESCTGFGLTEGTGDQGETHIGDLKGEARNTVLALLHGSGKEPSGSVVPDAFGDDPNDGKGLVAGGKGTWSSERPVIEDGRTSYLNTIRCMENANDGSSFINFYYVKDRTDHWDVGVSMKYTMAEGESCAYFGVPAGGTAWLIEALPEETVMALVGMMENVPDDAVVEYGNQNAGEGSLGDGYHILCEDTWDGHKYSGVVRDGTSRYSFPVGANAIPGTCAEHGSVSGEEKVLQWISTESALRTYIEGVIAKEKEGLPPDNNTGNDCTSVLTGIDCEGESGKGIAQLLNLVLSILTAGVGILATIGLVVSGIQYVTARDDAGVVTKVKSRIFNIVIGLVAYGLMWIILEWLIPGGILD